MYFRHLRALGESSEHPGVAAWVVSGVKLFWGAEIPLVCILSTLRGQWFGGGVCSLSSSDYHVRKPWRWGLGKPLRHEVFKPWYNNCIDIFIWLLVPVNDLSLESEVAPGLSAVILGQRKDELSQMQTNKFSRGKDNPPWLCYTSREWQSTANILPSLLPNLLSWVRWWPAPSWCLLSTINSQELLWLSFLSAQVSTCSLPPPCHCLMMLLIRGAVSLIFQGRQRKEPPMSLGYWCPDVSETDGLLRKQETWKEVSAFSMAVSNFSCLSKHRRWISLCLTLLRGKGGKHFVRAVGVH